MSVVIIALKKQETAGKIRSVLVSHGFPNVICVPNGAAALLEAGKDTFGIVISGYSLPDMYYKELSESLPPYFQLLFVGNPEMIQSNDAGILALSVPLRVSDLISTVSMMLSQLQRSRKKDQKKPKKRTWQEENYIRNAKFLLMERNHLSEEDAHRYIQKCSMDNGTNMVETAQMILTLMYDEV